MAQYVKSIQNRFLSAIRHGNLEEVSELISFHGLSHCKGEPEGFGYALVCCAAKYDRAEIIKLLLSHDCSVNSKTSNTSSPLHHAIWEGSPTLVICLLHKGASINAQDQKGWSPLHLAIMYGRSLIVELLLNENADPNIKTLSGATTMHIAAQCGKKDLCEMLLNSGAELNVSDEDGTSPLHLAIKGHNREITELFLNNSADVDISDNAGKTPLCFAVEKGYLDLAEFLLGKNASPNKKTNDGVNPVYVSTLKGREDLFFLLIKFGGEIDVDMYVETKPSYYDARKKKSILHQVVSNGCVKIMECILKNCKVDVGNDLFKDLLGIAVEQKGANAANIVNILADHGFYLSDEDMRENYGLISTVVLKGYSEVLEKALQRGLDVNLPVKTRYFSCPCTLLHIAVNCEHSKIVELLLTYGARTDVKDRCKYFPLNYAIKNINHRLKSNRSCFCYSVPYSREECDLKSMEFLLRAGSNVDFETEEGQTPILEAVNDGNFRAVELLLSYDADVFCEEPDDSSTFFGALINPQYNILKLLFNVSFDISATDKDGSLREFISEFLTEGLVDPLPENCEKLLRQHIIKLKAADLFSNETFLNLPVDTSYTRTLKEECDAELSAMKDNRIGEWSFYDILNCSGTQVTELLRKENFRTAIEESAWRTKYPLYEGFIYQKVLKADRRRKLVNEYEAILSSILPLPNLCVYKVVNYFSNQELRRLIWLSKAKLHSNYFDKRNYTYER